MAIGVQVQSQPWLHIDISSENNNNNKTKEQQVNKSPHFPSLHIDGVVNDMFPSIKENRYKCGQSYPNFLVLQQKNDWGYNSHLATKR